VDESHTSSMDVRRVETLEIRTSALEQCKLCSDKWGLEVHSRLMTCCDLVAEEAVYHKNCVQLCELYGLLSDIHLHVPLLSYYQYR